MAFNMPDLPIQGGSGVRIHNNKVVANNTANFAPTSQIVAGLPTGTGVLVLAIKNVEIFKNTIKHNNTANISVSTFAPPEDKPLKDQNYNPYNAAVYIHDNDISGGGKQPDLRLPKIAALTKATGKTFADIMYDGVIEPKDGKPGKPEDAKICVENNGDASFLNYDAGNGFKKLVKDVKVYKCSLPALATVSIPQTGNAGGGL